MERQPLVPGWAFQSAGQQGTRASCVCTSAFFPSDPDAAFHLIRPLARRNGTSSGEPAGHFVSRPPGQGEGEAPYTILSETPHSPTGTKVEKDNDQFFPRFGLTSSGGMHVLASAKSTLHPVEQPGPGGWPPHSRAGVLRGQTQPGTSRERCFCFRSTQ